MMLELGLGMNYVVFKLPSCTSMAKKHNTVRMFGLIIGVLQVCWVLMQTHSEYINKESLEQI